MLETRNHGELGPLPTQPPPTGTQFDANSAFSKTHPHQVDPFSISIIYLCITEIMYYVFKETSLHGNGC